MVITVAEDLASNAPEIRGKLEAYFIPTMHSFVDGQYQIGSLFDLERALDDEEVA